MLARDLLTRGDDEYIRRTLNAPMPNDDEDDQMISFYRPTGGIDTLNSWKEQLFAAKAKSNADRLESGWDFLVNSGTSENVWSKIRTIDPIEEDQNKETHNDPTSSFEANISYESIADLKKRKREIEELRGKIDCRVSFDESPEQVEQDAIPSLEQKKRTLEEQKRQIDHRLLILAHEQNSLEENVDPFSYEMERMVRTVHSNQQHSIARTKLTC